MTCTFCNDTGSLSKDVCGFLDCTHCPAASERVDLERWYKTVVKPQQLPVQDALWLAVLRERQINQCL